ncbi:Ctr copper transporter family-domain-containing protein [Thermothelomyces heterothallicus CBS 202.75]|uniref:Ctr copper transporter family-domain-containing protein n=1 Tax=Thermothelomyces heterothallicus CBS 202.75 TaxID=1149848 RepID=UPI003742811A
MDHHDMTGMSSMATMTTTAAAAAATSSGKSGMGGMGGMGSGNGCKISMLWNWNTIDACFIAKSWKITSRGVFAGSCIGVVLLVVVLEMLRRSVKEYDRFLLNKHLKSLAAAKAIPSPKTASDDRTDALHCPAVVSQGYRPNVFEQAIRALLHMLQFAVAYFIMLLAMYYNGYIIICIFIGAYIGSFIFHWETLGGGQQTSASKEATVCCG